jgi:hypothetical protein
MGRRAPLRAMWIRIHIARTWRKFEGSGEIRRRPSNLELYWYFIQYICAHRPHQNGSSSAPEDSASDGPPLTKRISKRSQSAFGLTHR